MTSRQQAKSGKIEVAVPPDRFAVYKQYKEHGDGWMYHTVITITPLRTGFLFTAARYESNILRTTRNISENSYHESRAGTDVIEHSQDRSPLFFLGSMAGVDWGHNNGAGTAA